MAETSDIRIQELWVYPIKSLGGIRLQQSRLTARGLQYDRRWMLLDTEGNFLTQRQHAQMALVQVALNENQLHITHSQKNVSPLSIPLEPADFHKTVKAPIWDDLTTAWHLSPAYDRWFSDVLGMDCSLIYMPDSSERQVRGKFSGKQQSTSFADDYPILLIGQESLNDLNARLPEAVPMNRFRPNVVTSGAEAFAEDQWHAFEIAGQPFYAEKPCARCVVTTINQATAQKGAEPLRTLATYRKTGNKVLFGQDILCPPSGEIKVGDSLVVKSSKPAPIHAD